MGESESIFTITPMTQKLLLEPGEVREGTLLVVNPADAKASFAYKVGVTPYNVVGNDYAADLATKTERSRLVDWITIDEPLGAVAPNQSKEIHYTIRVPKDAPAGGQYAAITVGSDERDTSSAEGMTIKNVYEMASVLYAQVSGEIIRSGEVLENDIPGFVTALPIITRAKIKNDGNIHETAQVKVTVKNFLNGSQLYPNETQEENTEEMLMPETERAITREVSDLSPVGLYEVTQTIEYLGKTSSSSSLVIACPIWFMAMIAVTLGVIIFGIVMLIRRHRKNKIVV